MIDYFDLSPFHCAPRNYNKINDVMKARKTKPLSKPRNLSLVLKTGCYEFFMFYVRY
jgi:hypothetical protein